MAAGLRFYYEYTLVDADGFESAPSPATFVDTQPPVAEPSAPTLSYVNDAGSLLPGSYSYVLSAYKAANTL